MAQTLRWALLGNAVSVDVGRWLGERLGAPFRYKYMLGPKDRKLMPVAATVPCERYNRSSPCATSEALCALLLQLFAQGHWSLL